MAQSKDKLKLLTLNTHSWQETDSVSCLRHVAETLRQELAAGKFDSAFAGLRPQEQAAFRQVLGDPKKLDQIMNSRQARALYDRLTKK